MHASGKVPEGGAQCTGRGRVAQPVKPGIDKGCLWWWKERLLPGGWESGERMGGEFREQ